MDKENLRQSMIRKLKQLPKEERNRFEQQLVNHLLSSPLWRNSQVIGVTIHQSLEWTTEPIIQAGWEQDKTIAVPKCYPETKRLSFYKFTSYDELEIVYYNLKEPKPEQTKHIHKNDIELLIVPGLVFDQQGYRIGFGGGYYDRFLEDFKQATVSLLGSFQLIDKVPTQSYDIPVDHIITEKGLIK